MKYPFLAITYSNPIYGSLPNAISYRFPVFRSSPRNSPDCMHVCLYAQLAECVQHGLYFEEDRVLRDMLWDWDVFWSPMESLLAGLHSPMPMTDENGPAPQESPRQQEGEG
jgi:hypothetical protein